MTLGVLQFRPGLFEDLTDYAAEGGWIRSNLVRFRDGLPEPVGGWTRFIDDPLRGVARAMHAWTDLQGNRLLAIGTTHKLYVLYGSRAYDITPYRSAGTLSGAFATTSGSSVVTVTHAAHGVQVGDELHYSGASAVGGITISGSYSATGIVDADAYTISHSATATSTAIGGGTVGYQYEIAPGNVSAAAGRGWGVGFYGKETWGTPRTSAAVTIHLRTWSLDNWGEDLIACPRSGDLYIWDRSSGLDDNRATRIANSPSNTLAVVVSADDRHIIAVGADGEKLKVQWPNQETLTSWALSVDSTAGSRRLMHGSEIIAVLRTRGEILIWTEAALYSLVYTGAIDYAFTLRRVGEGVPPIGPRAVIDHGGSVYWMSRRAFYRYDGAVTMLPCPMLKTVFDQFMPTQGHKVIAGLNRAFGEVMFFYPTMGSGGENDRYVVFNFIEGVWYGGSLARTAWIDTDVYERPVAVSPDGWVLLHEIAHVDENGAKLNDWLESGDIDIADGEDVMFVRRLVPDFKLSQGGAVEISLKMRKFPGAQQVQSGPYMITSTTTQRFIRVRGRQASVRVSSSASGTHWRLGKMRFDAVPDGEQ